MQNDDEVTFLSKGKNDEVSVFSSDGKFTKCLSGHIEENDEYNRIIKKIADKGLILDEELQDKEYFKEKIKDLEYRMLILEELTEELTKEIRQELTEELRKEIQLNKEISEIFGKLYEDSDEWK